MKELREKAIINLEATLRLLKHEFAKGLDDINDTYFLSCGRAWGYCTLGLITDDETLSWIEKFADACEGR